MKDLANKVLAAVGLAEPAPVLSHAERKASAAAKLAAIAEERNEHDLIARKALGDYHSAKDAEVAKIAADSEAATLQISKALAVDVDQTIGPLFAKHHADGSSRKTTIALRTALREFKARALHELGVELDTHLVLAVLAQVLIDNEPNLVSIFASGDIFAGPCVELITKLFQFSSSDFVTEFETALSALEIALENVARLAPRSPANEDHKTSFEALKSYATAGHRAAEVSKLRDIFGARHAADLAKNAAAYKRPSNVISGPGVEPRIDYEAPANTTIGTNFADVPVEFRTV